MSGKYGNEIRNCYITGFDRGIYLKSSSKNNIIKDNTVESNVNYGIYLDSSLNNTLQGNDILNNKVGIYSLKSNSVINTNVVCGNTNYDLYSSAWLTSSGDNNNCTKPDGWKDGGIPGCRNTCS